MDATTTAIGNEFRETGGRLLKELERLEREISSVREHVQEILDGHSSGVTCLPPNQTMDVQILCGRFNVLTDLYLKARLGILDRQK